MKAVHVLHSNPVDVQVNVDEQILLTGFLHLFSRLYFKEGHVSPCIRMLIALLGISLSLKCTLFLSPFSTFLHSVDDTSLYMNL